MGIKLAERAFYGITGRGNNSNPAPIGIAWQKFVTIKPAGECFGIYTNYESDYQGDYDFILASPTQFEGAEPVVLMAGDYLEFEVPEGQAGVAKMWGKIWNMDINRAYTTDFEHYQNDGKVKIYIALTK